MFAFWVVTMCGLLGEYERFGRTKFLHFSGPKINVATSDV
jgi:hypothetical protein